MGLLPLLISLIFPACAEAGANGIPIPPPMDFTHIERPATPNTALAAPAGFIPAPDIVTRRYAVAPGALFAAVDAVALAQPRTYPQVHYADRQQAHYVARSAVWNFPDMIAVQVMPNSTLVLWSRSIYGRSDLGANRARLTAWLATLNARLAAR